MPTRESHPHGMPSWCDMSSRDIEAAKAFYGALFGWEMHTAPEPEAGGYTMALLKGRAAAAITPQQQEKVDLGIPPHWTMYFTVDDVDAMAAKVEAAGGSVMAPPFDVMTAGRMTGEAITSRSPSRMAVKAGVDSTRCSSGGTSTRVTANAPSIITTPWKIMSGTTPIQSAAPAMPMPMMVSVHCAVMTMMTVRCT